MSAVTKESAVPKIDPLAVRQRMGLNQSQFWSRLGITQSGGSRYENGRNIPKPVQILLAISYGTEKQRERALQAVSGYRRRIR